MCHWQGKDEIKRLQDYLRIRSVHPEPDYDSCVKFLKQQAKELGLPVTVTEYVKRKPVVVISWEGTHPSLPAILLNSHMDVVPVSEKYWTHPPFEAHITEEGMIYARGIQDMKSVGMMHLESIRRMKQAGLRLKRTVHVSFVPDEEIGSQDGMLPFSKSKEFKKLNIGFEFDESTPHHNVDEFYAFNCERTSRQIKVTCKAAPGHGSMLYDNTAGEKFHYVFNKFMELRAKEKKKLNEGVLIGDVTTINLTQLEGGVQINILPELITACFDIRIAPDVDHKTFEETIETWCAEAGEGVSFEYLVKNPEVEITRLQDNPFWTQIKDTLDKLGKTVHMCTCPGANDARWVRHQGIPAINLTPVSNTPLVSPRQRGKTVHMCTCPGATDARWVRHQGIPAINLTPVSNTPMGLHAHDERMHVDEYLKAIGVMQSMVRAAAEV